MKWWQWAIVIVGVLWALGRLTKASAATAPAATNRLALPPIDIDSGGNATWSTLLCVTPSRSYKGETVSRMVNGKLAVCMK